MRIKGFAESKLKSWFCERTAARVASIRITTQETTDFLTFLDILGVAENSELNFKQRCI